MPHTAPGGVEYFEAIVDCDPNCIRILDTNGCIEFLNRAGRELLGVPDFETSLRGRYWPDLWPENLREVVESAWRAAKAGETRTFRGRLPSREGAIRWLDTTVAPVLGGPERAVQRILAISRDISEEVKAHSLLQTLLECVPGALFVKELDSGRFVFLNPAAERLFNSPAEVMIGKSDADFLPPEQVEAIRAGDHRAAEMESVFLIDEEPVQSAGETIYLRTRKMATPSADGVRHVVCLAEDVTEERRRKLALNQALTEAEAGNQAKNEFLAMMGHEIRTPLNAVLGMAQVMALNELSEPQRHRLGVIQKSGEQLLSLLNDLLDLSRMQTGGLQIAGGVVEAGELVAAAKSLFEGLAAAKDISFEAIIEPGAAGPRAGDPTRVRQIIANLIGNAVKFTERGVVTLRLKGDASRLVIEVSDTGPGIPKDKISRLFVPFDQLDASMTRRHGGSGLGLAICKGIAELMGGEIEVRSSPGAGTTFCVTLPLLRDSSAREAVEDFREEQDIADAPAQTLKVLAAEDNPTNQLVLKSLLDAIGMDLHLVPNGEEALTAWRREAWDLILMDIQMPVLDGTNATKLIRAEERRKGLAPTPILALTANAMPHQVDDYLAAGMDGVVAKPIEVQALLHAIVSHACAATSAEAGDLESPRSSLAAH